MVTNGRMARHLWGENERKGKRVSAECHTQQFSTTNEGASKKKVCRQAIVYCRKLAQATINQQPVTLVYDQDVQNHGFTGRKNPAENQLVLYSVGLTSFGGRDLTDRQDTLHWQNWLPY